MRLTTVKDSFADLLCLASSWFKRSVAARVLLVLAALGLDCLTVPSLYRTSTLCAVLVLLVLILRKRTGEMEEDFFELPVIHPVRLFLFAALHATLLLLCRSFIAMPDTVSGTASAPGALLTLARLAVLLPAFVLFPLRSWRPVARRYRSELLGSLIVFLTFFPVHVMEAAWPWYSRWLGHLVYRGSLPFVAGLQYLGGTDPIISGPALDLQIVVGCSGIEGVSLFDLMFGLVVLIEWNRLFKARAFVCYAAGTAAFLAANVVRIILLVVLGNRLTPEIAMGHFHKNAGWVFFVLVFLGIMRLTYNWMRRPSDKKVRGVPDFTAA